LNVSATENPLFWPGSRLHEVARGFDHNPVISNRVRKQISAEDTFPDDLPLEQCETHIRRLAEKSMGCLTGQCSGREDGWLEVEDERVQLAYAMPDCYGSFIFLRRVRDNCADALSPG
jgi:DNA polymerase-4